MAHSNGLGGMSSFEEYRANRRGGEEEQKEEGINEESIEEQKK